MKIHVASATTSGPTELAAFDNCLQECGVADQNIIYLSSIIPAGSEIMRQKPAYNETHFGNRLYTVMAQKRETAPNAEAWAGIGWVQDASTGKGLFVEHEGSNQQEVERDLHATLTDMMARRSDAQWSNIQTEVVGMTFTDQPVCAMVVAAYQSVGW